MEEQQLDIAKTHKKTRKQKSPKNLFIGIGVIAVAAIGIALYYNHTRKYPSTDDAYVNANLINVAPKVGGFIKNINVTKNQLVHKGDLLFEIDPIDYMLESNQTAHQVSYAQQQVDVESQNILVAKVNIAKAQADYDYNRKMAKRYTDLFKQKAGTEQDMQKYINSAIQSKQQLDAMNLAYIQANTLYKSALAQLNANKSALDTAITKTSYAQVYAGVDGFVTDLNLADGQLVQAGQNLFGLVDDSSWWIDANFKETQLERIKVGQPVKVKLDIYSHEYQGVVQSISRASGNTFSILPAQNATGNWVKVTQRFAVVVKVEDDPKYPLRVGASTEVTIDTTK
jgi:membrane fusion protein (multidrug efflux system)